MNDGDKSAKNAQDAYTEAMTYKAKAESEAVEAQSLGAKAQEAAAASNLRIFILFSSFTCVDIY